MFFQRCLQPNAATLPSALGVHKRVLRYLLVWLMQKDAGILFSVLFVISAVTHQISTIRSLHACVARWKPGQPLVGVLGSQIPGMCRIFRLSRCALSSWHGAGKIQHAAVETNCVHAPSHRCEHY